MNRLEDELEAEIAESLNDPEYAAAWHEIQRQHEADLKCDD